MASEGPAHPSYKEMIKNAIKETKDRKGVTRQAIKKYILEHYKVGDNSGKMINNGLKRGVANGIFETAKDNKARFKLSEATKAEKPPAKKPVAKKPAAAKKPKKPAAKKVTKPAAKKPTKSPKKGKSPAKPKTKKPAGKAATKKATAKKATPKKGVKKPAAKKAGKPKK